jgi:AraC-like DNA-binding protein
MHRKGFDAQPDPFPDAANPPSRSRCQSRSIPKNARIGDSRCLCFPFFCIRTDKPRRRPISAAASALSSADLANLDKLEGLGALIASIGGAGTFDGVFVTGIVAVLSADRSIGDQPKPKYRRPNCRAVEQSFGVPPQRYHNIRRIEHAKSLLVKPACSVTEIGLSVGFSETSSFTASFRKATGSTRPPIAKAWPERGSYARVASASSKHDWRDSFIGTDQLPSERVLVRRNQGGT